MTSGPTSCDDVSPASQPPGREGASLQPPTQSPAGAHRAQSLRGAREAGERGRAGARGRIDTREACARSRGRSRGERYEATVRTRSVLTSNVSKPAQPRNLTRTVRAISLTTTPQYALTEPLRRVEADGNGVARPDRVGVDRRAGDDDAVGLAVGVVVGAGAGAGVVVCGWPPCGLAGRRG